ncbi:hypothetical protein GCM10029992_64730 [Glycomyces albus]
MAKKALIAKAKRKPKFAVRAYTRCQKCGRPKAVYRKFGLCRVRARDGPPRRTPRRPQGFLVDRTPAEPAREALQLRSPQAPR